MGTVWKHGKEVNVSVSFDDKGLMESAAGSILSARRVLHPRLLVPVDLGRRCRTG